MPVHRENIGEVVLNAWNDARHAIVEDGDKGKANNNRSKKWIDSLAKRFTEHYGGKRHRLFWSGNSKNQEHFRKNEFLFDLAVCSVSTTKSLERKAKPLEFIAQCHWQIESEFNRKDTREIIIDMSKLVMGSAENKLFIAAHDREEAILEQCSEIAGRCTGQVYFGFISHPDCWASDSEVPPALPTLHEWNAGCWVKVSLPS